MGVEWCKVCGQIMFVPPIGAPHKCPPKFEIIHDDYDPEHTWTVFAVDHEQASEKWADLFDSEDCDYTIAEQKEEPVIRVRKVGEEDWRKFKVSGEIVPSYSAEEVRDEKV